MRAGHVVTLLQAINAFYVLFQVSFHMRAGHVVTLLQAINAFYATADHVLFYGSLGKQNYLTIQAFVPAIMGRNSEDINRFVRYKSTIMRTKVQEFLLFLRIGNLLYILQFCTAKKKKDFLVICVLISRIYIYCMSRMVCQSPGFT